VRDTIGRGLQSAELRKTLRQVLAKEANAEQLPAGETHQLLAKFDEEFADENGKLRSA